LLVVVQPFDADVLSLGWTEAARVRSTVEANRLRPDDGAKRVAGRGNRVLTRALSTGDRPRRYRGEQEEQRPGRTQEERTNLTLAHVHSMIPEWCGADGSAVRSPHRATGGPGGTEHVHDQAAGHDARDAIGAVVARRYLYDIHTDYAVLAGNSS